MYDLIYAGEHRQEIELLVREAYPEAKVEDASDFIHQGRFSVEMTIEETDWYLFMLREGFFPMSFMWQMVSMEHPEIAKPLILQVIEEKGLSDA